MRQYNVCLLIGNVQRLGPRYVVLKVAGSVSIFAMTHRAGTGRHLSRNAYGTLTRGYVSLVGSGVLEIWNMVSLCLDPVNSNLLLSILVVI